MQQTEKKIIIENTNICNKTVFIKKKVKDNNQAS